MADAAPYDAIAAEYYEPVHKTSRNFDQATTAALSRLNTVFPDGLILEAGCGRGRTAEFLGINAAERVVQLDNSSIMLQLEPREPSLVQVLHEAEKLPFPDDHFAGVTAFLCDPFLGLNFMAEARRVVRPGGRIFGTTPTDVWANGLRPGLNLDGMETRFVLASGEGEIHVPSAVYSQSQILEMLKVVGFSEVAVHAECLPRDAQSVSPDIEGSANHLGIDLYELPIIYIFTATVPR